MTSDTGSGLEYLFVDKFLIMNYFHVILFHRISYINDKEGGDSDLQYYMFPSEVLKAGIFLLNAFFNKR